MRKILFIDDQEDILNVYKTIFAKPAARNQDLAKIAKEVFKNDEVSEQSKNYFENEFDPYFGLGGEAGVELFEAAYESQEPYQVVFLDVHMEPGPGGVEVAKKIRKIDASIEIVFVSAAVDRSLNDFYESLESAENFLLLKKPFDKTEVRQIAANLSQKYMLAQFYNNFFSHVSHEIKTPLASILGFTELLQEEEMSDDGKNYVQLILSSSRLLNNLVNDMFTFRLLKNQEIELQRKPIVIRQFFDSLVAKFKLLNPSKRLELKFRYDVKQEFLNVDPLRLEQAITNLFSNSLKFTKQGYIEMSFVEHEDMIVFEIDDSGSGLNVEDFKYAIGEFHRLGKYTPLPGLGLGLTLTSKITELHGGQFSVLRKEEPGTKINISLKKLN